MEGLLWIGWIGCVDPQGTDSTDDPLPEPTIEIVDNDRDGYGSDIDCDDANPQIHPDAEEICDGIDNDCDAAIDLDDDSFDSEAVEVYYVDVDGDGYGGIDPIEACAPPAGAVLEGGDCDDLDPDIHPDAEDACDGGIDNDCDPTTPDAGVAFEDLKGTYESYTSQFTGGTPATPAQLVFSTRGTLHLCEGTYYAGLSLTADIDVVGAGSDLTILDGGRRVEGIIVRSPITTSIAGLTLQHFAGVGQNPAGSALICDAPAIVSVDDVAFVENASYLGGSIVAFGRCGLTVTDSSFALGTAALGGHLATWGTQVTVTGTTFTGGIASLGGGSLFVGDPFVADAAPSTLTCTDCDFRDNDALAYDGGYVLYGYGGGAAWVYWNASLDLVGGSVEGNTTGDIGGGILLNALGYTYGSGESSVSLSGTTFDDNRDPDAGPDDVNVPAANAVYVYPGPVTATCTEAAGCL